MLLLLARLLDLLLLQYLIPIQLQVTHSFLELVQLLFALSSLSFKFYSQFT